MTRRGGIKKIFKLTDLWTTQRKPLHGFPTLNGLSSSTGRLWSPAPYLALSFSPSLSSLAAVSSIRVNQEQKRSAEGWKLCNDAIPEFKSLPRDDRLAFNFSYLNKVREIRDFFKNLGFRWSISYWLFYNIIIDGLLRIMDKYQWFFMK